MLPRLGGFGAGAEAGRGDRKHFNAGLEQCPCDPDVKAAHSVNKARGAKAFTLILSWGEFEIISPTHV